MDSLVEDLLELRKEKNVALLRSRYEETINICRVRTYEEHRESNVFNEVNEIPLWLMDTMRDKI